MAAPSHARKPAPAATDLRGVYGRIAEGATDDQVRVTLRALHREPQPYHPHIEQALDAFTTEAAKRGLELAGSGEQD